MVVVLAVYALIAPWSFHIGGRWTPNVTWYGVGRLRDSAGAQYGLYLQFFPYIHRGHGAAASAGHRPLLHNDLKGKASVCTAGGAVYQFDLSGEISGAWLHTDGAAMTLWLSERPGPKIRRAFRLYGTWQGGDLPLDDHKTMFMNFRPDGTLTPAGSYTSPVPEKHATVTLAWGSREDFDSLCASVAGGSAR